MKKIILVFVFLYSFIIMFSQSNRSSGNEETAKPREGEIKGNVIDAASEAPIEFTSVALYRDLDSSLITGSITDAGGLFRLKELPYGKYYLVANFMGYEKEYVQDLQITSGQRLIDAGTIMLRRSAKMLGEVEVLADQAHVKYKIDRKVINVSQDINAATGSAADVLQNTPSVSVDIDGNVSLRGKENFTVLVDGKPTPLSGSDALQQIPASAIRNIEIITNPSAKYDPDGMAGIINIVSKKNALDGLSGIVNAKIGTGEKYSGDFLLNYRSDKISTFIGGTFRNESYSGKISYLKELRKEGTTLYDELSGSRNRIRTGKEVKAGVDYYLNEKNLLGFSAELGTHEFASGGIQRQRLYNEDLSDNRYILSDNIASRGADYYNLNLNYTKKFDDQGHELVSFVSFSGQQGKDADSQIEYIADQEFDIIENTIPESIRTAEEGNEYEFRAQIDYSLPIGEYGKFEAGYQARIDDEVESYIFEKHDPDLNEWIINDGFSSSNDFFRNIQALYAIYGNQGGNFQYQLGLRGEYTDRRILNAESDDNAGIHRLDLFPSLHLSKTFKKDQQIMISYSRRINRPRGWYLEPFLTYMNSTTLRKGDPELDPEYMNSFELGYQKSFGPSFIAFEAYYQNTVNKIERIQELYNLEEGMTLMTYDNISSDHSLGAELMINYASPDWMTLNASTSVYRYRIEGEINDVKIDARSNNFDVRLNSTFNISNKTRIQLTGMFRGPSVTAQGTREAFFYTSAAVRHDFLDRKISATLQVRDIMGTMNHEMTSYGTGFTSKTRFSGEPRVILLSLSYKINNYRQRRNSPDQGVNMEMGEGDMF